MSASTLPPPATAAATPHRPAPDRKKLFLGVSLLFLFCLAAAYLLHASGHEVTDNAYTAAHVHSISPRVNGTVIEVTVDDNDEVKKRADPGTPRSP